MTEPKLLTAEQAAVALMLFVAGEEVEAQAAACLTEAKIEFPDPDRLRYELLHLRVYACVTAAATRWNRGWQSNMVVLALLARLKDVIENPADWPAFQAAVNSRLIKYGEAHEVPHALGPLVSLGATLAALADATDLPALPGTAKVYYVFIYQQAFEFLSRLEIAPPVASEN